MSIITGLIAILIVGAIIYKFAKRKSDVANDYLDGVENKVKAKVKEYKNK